MALFMLCSCGDILAHLLQKKLDTFQNETYPHFLDKQRMSEHHKGFHFGS